ncbi:MAG: hypothetical protein HYV03_02040 [Deltaproteobacteria bacterium]|nr:hypothetical protein [Deltaproteobacteria bacterium]
MSSPSLFDDFLRFDSRVIEHCYRRGVLTPEEYARYLRSLPDDSANMEEGPAPAQPPVAGGKRKAPTFEAA